MINESVLTEILRIGRLECYVKKSPTNNPYSPGEKYDWEFKLSNGQYVFTDSYRGFNPYSGVEYIFENESPLPLWSCDYVGYANSTLGVTENEIYGFLKKARGSHLDCTSRNFFDPYTISNGEFEYISTFNGDLSGLLQIEEITYRGNLVCRQVASGCITENGF